MIATIMIASRWSRFWLRDGDGDGDDDSNITISSCWSGVAMLVAGHAKIVVIVENRPVIFDNINRHSRNYTISRHNQLAMLEVT
jgi:hypothetical protein